jgi:negative regulator of flagellin synthesis FlgM
VNGSNPALTSIPSPVTGGADKTREAGKNDIAKIAAPATTVANPSVNARAGQSGGANVRISDDAKSRADGIAKALEIARNTPDVREDRVAELKKKIQDGTYQVDAGKVADGMLREAILEHLSDTSGN